MNWFGLKGSAKLEKAEILQMTVDHLKVLQAGRWGKHAPWWPAWDEQFPPDILYQGSSSNFVPVPSFRGRPHSGPGLSVSGFPGVYDRGFPLPERRGRPGRV